MTGTAIQHKSGTIITKGADVGEREAVFVASTSAPDRMGDVVEQDWDFRSFRKNPVLLFQHQSSSLPIGKVSRIWTEGAQTFAKAEAVPEGIDDLADKVWKFIKSGFLSAVSVGFRPIADPTPRKDKVGNWLGYTFPKNELLELSVVSVPANQEALAVARSFKFKDSDIKQIFDDPKGVHAGVKSARRFAEIQRLRVRN